jgi:hypothetical protein
MRRIGVIHTRNPRRSGIARADEVIESGDRMSACGK